MLIISPEQEANRNIFSIFFNMKVYCVFSLESPLRCDSNDCTQYTSFVIRKKITPDYPISVRATEVLLYIVVKGRKRDTNAFNHMVLNGTREN